MTKIWIDHEQCKGCGLCTTACPKQILKLSLKLDFKILFDIIYSWVSGH